jgi:hypothetical protein
MNWNAYVDGYCERLSPGLWGEPLNAISNLAFWLVAFLVWRGWRRLNLSKNQALAGIESAQAAIHSGANRLPWDINALLITQVLIGAGSLAFHTFATRWAAALNVLFIALYLHFYLAVYADRVLAIRWPHAAWGIFVFLILSQTAAWLWAQVAAAIGGAVFMRAGAASGYLGAWSVLLMLVAHSTFKQLPFAKHLAAAAFVFALSLSLRQIDLPLCSDWRWGTHFAWHLLNALTLGLTTWAVVLANTQLVSGLKLRV